MPRLVLGDGAVWVRLMWLRFIAVIGGKGRSGVTRYKLRNTSDSKDDLSFRRTKGQIVKSFTGIEESSCVRRRLS